VPTPAGDLAVPGAAPAPPGARVLDGAVAVQVAVCGPADPTAAEHDLAERIGGLLAEGGAVVLCGGGTGVMAAVAAGARAAGGLVVGVVSGGRATAAADVTVEVATRMGQARNVVLVASADAVITVGGSWGTLSEVAVAMRCGVPVVALGGWRVADAAGRPVDGVRAVDTPEEAVAAVFAQVADHPG
jgi:uncharacterized protein (TIGR00725 family)